MAVDELSRIFGGRRSHGIVHPKSGVAIDPQQKRQWRLNAGSRAREVDRSRHARARRAQELLGALEIDRRHQIQEAEARRRLLVVDEDGVRAVRVEIEHTLAVPLVGESVFVSSAVSSRSLLTTNVT